MGALPENVTEMAKGTDPAVNAVKGNTEIMGVLDEASIEIYPVPSKGHFTVAITSAGEKSVDILIFNASGSKVLERNNVVVTDRAEIEFDLTSSPAGVYYMKFTNGPVQVIKKVILSR
jgi:hypothetical protein